MAWNLQLPPSLLRPCDDFEVAPSDDLADILETYISNMEKAGLCKSRHEALITILKDIGAQ
jgi:hypothetical protein